LSCPIHIHALVLEGCSVKDAAGRIAFHPVGDVTALDVAETLQDAHVGIAGLVGRWRRDDAGWVDEAPATSALAVGSVQNTVALWAQPGQPVARVGEPSNREW
jgi:hypothetical protein